MAVFYFVSPSPVSLWCVAGSSSSKTNAKQQWPQQAPASEYPASSSMLAGDCIGKQQQIAWDSYITENYVWFCLVLLTSTILGCSVFDAGFDL